MKKLISLTCIAGACLALLLTSCDKVGGALKGVEGKVAGQVLNSSGRGRGYVSVELVPVDGAAGAKSFNTITEDSGSFMFEAVVPGKYKLYVKMTGGKELPSDNPEVNVGPGRTISKNIILQDPPAS